MNKRLLVNKIRKEFQTLKWKTAKHNVEGWDHYVLILDNKYVFRFPRKLEYQKRLYNEAMLLNRLANKVNIPVPEYEFIAKDKSFAGYKLIPGIQLSPEVFKTISKPARKVMAKQLARFFSILHKTHIKIAKKYKTRTTNTKKLYKELVKNTRKFIKPRISAKNYILVEKYLKEFGKFQHHSHTCLTHADIHQDHLLVTKEKNKMAGIIDFADRSIGDPALDFTELWLYGRDFIEEVYKHYTGPKDKDFLHRAMLYCKRIPLWVMASPFLGMRGKFNTGFKLFKRIYLQNPFI
jgi:aminoglycoside 2''-phosphotransferase